MHQKPLFEFSTNREKNTLLIKREFRAPISLIWQAWTTAQLLDQWWAPKPYRTQTRSLELKEGGTWLYAMIGPTHDTHWCKADYKKIELEKCLSWQDAFCDSSGNKNLEKPQSNWVNQFSEKEGITTVDVTIRHDSWEDVQTILDMGFKEGFTMGLQNLEDLMEQLRP